MSFISFQFIIFFILVTLLFFRLKNQKGRIILLLIASCYFYMSFIPEYIFILGGVIVADYFAGLQIEKNEGKKRKFWLLLSVFANVGALCVFKYYNFFIENIQGSFLFLGRPISLPLLKIALPLGLSFHTFQALSYTIEVYRKNQKAEKQFVVYALYVMFYPQLVAGPIERPQNILPQLKEFRAYDWENVKEGLTRIVWGFFKKAVIADRLAMIVDRTFSHTRESSSLALFAGLSFYYFQIYCDFSGYSDMALGAAKVMNIKLMENFNQPFFSKNVSDFWRRWNISLYSWFFDYVFNPLVITIRNLRRKAVAIALIFTFFLTGLWHGAAWKFIVYGLVNGIALTFEYYTRKQRDRFFGRLPPWLNKVSGIGITLVFIIFSRIFFRATDMAAACYYLKRIFACAGGSNYVGVNRVELALSVFLIGVMLFREKYIPGFRTKASISFYLLFIAMVVVCYLFGVFNENQFIYFQF